MRTFLLPLAVVMLFGVAPSRAESDAGPAKGNARQATGASFDSGMAASKRIRAADDFQLLLTGVRPLVFAAPAAFVVLNATPPHNVKRWSNIPYPKRPPNRPITIDWGR